MMLALVLLAVGAALGLGLTLGGRAGYTLGHKAGCRHIVAELQRYHDEVLAGQAEAPAAD